ncbi:hypothetical protein M3N64_05030 [Sporolactobacillus sp. CPB3-1]|uniref:Uncharacterized protein n=1 Tax=Sporolactobacillus mangiferae TaxID=2940498 RepID=A0ABT0M9J9_9BACL|nr:hypothetical protein [Sporolactobacillus mangiferae]MCL1631313.1 hypothetical protein [Sporolactobacillus mangiferae]
MADHVDDETFEIRKVDLEAYRFSPPGSMGWSASEYERILSHPEADIQSENFAPPGVPSKTLSELSRLPDRQLALQTPGTEPDQNHEKKKKQTVEAEQSTAPSKKQEREPENEGYIMDTNPPEKPWLAQHLISLYIK